MRICHKSVSQGGQAFICERARRRRVLVVRPIPGCGPAAAGRVFYRRSTVPPSTASSRRSTRWRADCAQRGHEVYCFAPRMPGDERRRRPGAAHALAAAADAHAVPADAAAGQPAQRATLHQAALAHSRAFAVRYRMDGIAVRAPLRHADRVHVSHAVRSVRALRSLRRERDAIRRVAIDANVRQPGGRGRRADAGDGDAPARARRQRARRGRSQRDRRRALCRGPARRRAAGTPWRGRGAALAARRVADRARKEHRHRAARVRPGRRSGSDPGRSPATAPRATRCAR